ncbi:hypothetical protein SLEP1_g34850 [Rubroshorea leprosula]|uniref:Uncharacterized protein n=1 Tax=Rubroshorea leprosula TaxID=152421 RepID=A0AAV5KLQ9_9ROSI|nr:hypothetical protein SLEP1_g34850 [Rubroshorea leprosula]
MGERTLTFRGKPRKPINSLSPTLPQHSGVASPSSLILTGNGIAGAVKGKKKPRGARLRMRFDRDGKSKVMELDKRAIIRHAKFLARDLRILSPLFSQSSNILGRSHFTVNDSNGFSNPDLERKKKGEGRRERERIRKRKKRMSKKRKEKG